MATNCCSPAAARRLSDLLKEQQEPLLLLHLLLQDHDDSASPAAARRRLLRGSTAATVTKLALRWADDVLAGCFSFPCAATRQRLRRLPRADRLGDDVVAPADCHDDGAGDCGRQQQLSPVSVLDLHSDDDESSSPVTSHRDDEHRDDHGNGNPSTTGTGTGTSPPPPPPSIHDLPGRSRAPTTEEKFQSVAADISRIPRLMELDLSASPRDDWRRLVVGGGEEEPRQLAQSIEAMIFEEVRWETVHDMLCFTEH